MSSANTPNVGTPDKETEPFATETENISEEKKMSVISIDGSAKGKAKQKESKNPSLSDEGKAVVASGEWKEFFDAKKSKYYYLHVKEKKTVWDLDVELKKRRSSVSSAVPELKSLLHDRDTSPDSGKATRSVNKSQEMSNKSQEMSNKSQEMNKKDSPVEKPPLTPPSNPYGVKLKSDKGDKKLSTDTQLSPVKEPERTVEPPSDPSPRLANVPAITAESIINQQQENQGALQSLLDENRKLQEMLAAGMSGPIALDFGGKLDALTRTNHSLTIQIKRLNTEHGAMVRALTDANVRIHEQKQEIDSLQSCNYINPTSNNSAPDNEVGVTMTHLRDTNRQLVQQVGELSALLARSLADQSFTTAAMADKGRLDSEAGGLSGYQYDGYARSISEAGRIPMHNPNSAYLIDSEVPQYEQLDSNGQRSTMRNQPDTYYSRQTLRPKQSSRSPNCRNQYYNQSGAIGGYPQRSSSLSSIVSGPQYGQGQSRSGFYQSPSVLSGQQYKSPGVTYGGFIVRSPNSPGGRSMSCR